MVLRDSNDPLNHSRGIMGPLENAAGVQNNRGRLRQRFDLIRKLGQGTYGKVQLGIDKETGQEVAIKTIKKSKIETEADLIRIRREIQIMSSVRHPNIIHIYEVFENREKMVLVMEYAAGGELYDYLSERKILQEDEARRIFRQIASAVYYCHKHKICHRDLKLENILLDEKFNAKIADFGLSNVFDEVNMLKTFCGSPLYASPEIVRGTPYKGPEVDCWSLGVLLYTLVYGAMPFDGSNFKRLVKQISHGDYFEPKKPAEASPLIRTMLTVDPKKRADARKVCSHPWVNQGFDQDCLLAADELATQTPVRLDLLLALANCSAINHNQVVVDEDGGAAGGAPPPSLQNHVEEGGKAPMKPKRKIHSKSKSKSSPLLDLIPDVREELEMPSPTPGGADDEGDDACDTLSEISEIQTLAEDLPKDKPKAKKAKKEGKSEAMMVQEAASAPPEAAVSEVPPEPKKKTEKVDDAVAKAVEVPSEKPPEEKVVKKKVKPKVAEVAPPQSEKKDETVAVAPPTPPAKPAEAVVSSREVTPVPPASVKEKSATPDKESDSGGTPTSKSKKLKERSDSVSPTRIERRNSKVISQKTAELIQNLETKVSPSSASGTSTNEPPPKPPGIKKIVIPCFKVSDAKSKFESKPPRPLTTSVSRSKAAFEAKALQSQSSVEEKTKPSPPPSGVSGESSDAGERSSTSPEKAPPPTRAPQPSKPEVAPKPEPPKQAEVEQNELPKPEAEKRSVSPAQQKKVESPKASAPPPAEVAPAPPKPQEEVKPTEPKPKPEPPKRIGIGKLQIPAHLAANDKVATQAELKPVLLDSGKPGGPRPAVMITKGKTTHLPDIRNLSSAPQPQPPQTAPTIKTEPSTKALATPVTTSKAQESPSAGACNKVNAPESDTEGGSTAPTAPLGPAAAAKQKLLSKLPPPANKEQAAKQISSVITKIVSSGSASKGLNSEEGPKKFSTLPRVKPESEKIIKTEVSFPVSAPQQQLPQPATPPTPTQSQQERIIPIQFVQEEAQSSSEAPATPSTAVPSASASAASVATSQTPSTSRARMDSFRRLDSSGSVFSRQDSSDTESYSVACHPKKLEPLKKCPREFLIPIKLEGSGQTVTPKEECLASSTVDASQGGGGDEDDDFRLDSRLRSGRFGRQKRYSSLLSDSSFDEDASVSLASAGQSRRPSGTPSLQSGVASHTRSRSQGDEPPLAGGGSTGTFKRYRSRRHQTAAADTPLDRSDSFSSAEEDEEDAFQVLTAESLFSNLLDRVRNLTRRINRDDPIMTPNWSTDPTTFGLWGASPLREFMSRAPSETRSVGSYGSSHHKPFSREPSVTMAASGGPGGAWRRSLSRDVSGESDSASMNHVNPQSRSGIGRLSSDLYTIPGGVSSSTSVRSLPLSSHRSPSYLSQRSINENSELGMNHHHIPGSSAHTLATSPRSTYSRTLSHTDYSSPNSSHSPVSRTLPLRRSLKTFDRSPQSILPEYDTAGTGVGGGMGIGATLPPTASSSRYSSLLHDSMSKYEPTSNYLTRLRSMSREREQSVTKSLLGANGVSPAGGYFSGESNGWVGGQDVVLHNNNYQPSLTTSFSNTTSSISPVSTQVSLDSSQLLSPDSTTTSFPYLRAESPTPSSSSSRLSVQEKMNNYSQYYQSLSQSPFRRLPLASPSQIHSQSQATATSATTNGIISSPFGVGLTQIGQSRPVSLQEDVDTPTSLPLTVTTSNCKVDAGAIASPSEEGTPIMTVSPSNVSSLTSPSSLSPLETQVHSPASKPSPPMLIPEQPSPKQVVVVEEQPKTKPPTGGSSTSSSIPRWPNVSVRQHRPLSISSFPEGHAPRASSVSRVMSPPPSVQEGAEVNGKGEPAPTTSVAASVQKRREGRATSVERITRLLERKSVPREIPAPVPTTTSPPTPVETTAAAPLPINPVKPEQSLEQNGDSVTPNGHQAATTTPPEKVHTGIRKPKFLQSLEKKWEKLTHHGSGSQTVAPPPPPKPDFDKCKGAVVVAKKEEPEPVRRVSSPEPPQTGRSSEESSTHEDKTPNESVLLRRALSPEKKVKSATMSLATRLNSGGTVNAMLGKFKRMEKTTPASETANASKIPTGRPPAPVVNSGAVVGNGVTATPPVLSRFGRRVQQAYVGARSDSVLTAFPPKETGRSEVNVADEGGMIKHAAVMAQEKRRPRVEIRKDGPSAQAPPSPGPTRATPQNPPKQEVEIVEKKNVSERAPSLAPPQQIPNTLKPASPLPEIEIQEVPPTSDAPPLEVKDGEGKLMPTIDLSSLSPISVDDSTCSSVEEQSISAPPPPEGEQLNGNSGPAAGDDEESVSDRILRKSFYNRFNSATGMDRNRRSASIGPSHSHRPLSASGGTSNGPHLHPSNRNSGGGIGMSPQNRLSVGSTSSERGGGAFAPVTPRGGGSTSISTRRSVSPAASTIASSVDSDQSGQNRSPSPYWTSTLNKYNPNPLFKELITTGGGGDSDSGSVRSSDVGKKTEYSRRITSKLSKLLREIESDLNSCQLTKSESNVSEDGDLIGGGGGVGGGGTSHSHLRNTRLRVSATPSRECYEDKVQ